MRTNPLSQCDHIKWLAQWFTSAIKLFCLAKSSESDPVFRSWQTAFNWVHFCHLSTRSSPTANFRQPLLICYSQLVVSKYYTRGKNLFQQLKYACRIKKCFYCFSFLLLSETKFLSFNVEKYLSCNKNILRIFLTIESISAIIKILNQ